MYKRYHNGPFSVRIRILIWNQGSISRLFDTWACKPQEFRWPPCLGEPVYCLFRTMLLKIGGRLDPTLHLLLGRTWVLRSKSTVIASVISFLQKTINMSSIRFLHYRTSKVYGVKKNLHTRTWFEIQISLMLKNIPGLKIYKQHVVDLEELWYDIK